MPKAVPGPVGTSFCCNSQVVSAVNGTYGQLTLNRDGSYSYIANTPAANGLKAGQTATDVFTYQVSDGKGGLSQTTLSLRVTGSNDGPLAQADRASISENGIISKTAAQGLLANDSDADRDTLTITGIIAEVQAPQSSLIGNR